MTCLNRDGSVLDTDKGIWQQGRFTWLLGELFNNVDRRDEWLDVAKHGIAFLDEHGFDAADGRMWFEVDRRGVPLRKRRYSFSESFAAIAYGELARATGKAEFADRAQQCFEQFLEHNLNPPPELAKSTGHRPTRGIGFPMITINTAQELRDSIELESAESWIDRSIESIEQFHIKEDIRCVVETVAEDGSLIDHFEGRTLNPGHAIEGAWFILSESIHRKDAQLQSLGCRMLDWMWERGWDQEHGGLLYFVGIDEKPIQEYWHDMKFWWPQNEAIIATLMACLLTGERRYAEWHEAIHEWAFRSFPDTEHGEWFGYLHRDGRISSQLKGNIWKGAFHLPRMLLTCWKSLEALGKLTLD